jgi:hypothetical protein
MKRRPQSKIEEEEQTSPVIARCLFLGAETTDGKNKNEGGIPMLIFVKLQPGRLTTPGGLGGTSWLLVLRVSSFVLSFLK